MTVTTAEVSKPVASAMVAAAVFISGHPLPFPEEERGGEGGRGSRDPHQWSWLPLYTAVAVLAYLLTSSVEPVPEISFPFFLQHMLYAGEVLTSLVHNYSLYFSIGQLLSPSCQVHHLVVNSQRDRVFVHLHSGAVVNGWEVRITLLAGPAYPPLLPGPSLWSSVHVHSVRGGQSGGQTTSGSGGARSSSQQLGPCHVQGSV